MAALSFETVAARQAATGMFTQTYPPLAPEGTSLLICVAVMWFLSTAWTFMRILAHYIRKSPFQLEDWLYFVGYAFWCGLAITYILAVCIGGAGNDIGRLNPETHLHFYSRNSLANQAMYAASLCFIKMSIICTIKRVFATTGSWLHIACWVTFGVVIIWTIYTIIISFIICKPVESAWGAATPTSCGNQVMAISAVAVIDILSEVMIVALPMRMLSKLQIAKAHKVGLYAVFGAGAITIIFSCVRLYYALHIDFNNVTKAFAVASVSSVIQSGIAIMVSSSPLLRPIFDRTILRWFNISIRSTRKNTSGNPSYGGPSAGVSNRSGTRFSGVCSGNNRFQRMGDSSQEHLAWEMCDVEAKRKRDGHTTVQATRLSDDSAERYNGRIMVTRETSVQR